MTMCDCRDGMSNRADDVDAAARQNACKYIRRAQKYARKKACKYNQKAQKYNLEQQEMLIPGEI